AICKTTIADAVPLTIPDISPITSLLKLANLSAFLIMMTLSLAPFTFSDAIALKGASFAAVDAIPNISNRIPTKMIRNTINKPTIQTTSHNIEEEMIEKIAANTKAITAMVKLNFNDRFICEFINYLYCKSFKYFIPLKKSYVLCNEEWSYKR